MSGFSDSGFEAADPEEVRSRLVSELGKSFTDIDTDPDSPTGQLIDVFSLIYSELWAELQAMADALNPSSAVGVPLFSIGQYNGIQQLAAAPSRIDAILGGVEGAFVPAGSIAEVSANGDQYALQAEVTITEASVQRADFSYNSAVDGVSYSILINGFQFDFVGGVGEFASDAEYAQATVSAFNIAVSGFTATYDNATGFYIEADIVGRSFSCSSIGGAELSLTKPYTGGVFIAEETGPKDATVNGLDTIVSPATGWETVGNRLEGQRGRFEENSQEFRARRIQSKLIASGTSPLGIQSRIFDQVEGVSTCTVFENPKSFVDIYNRPPHCVHVVVENGEPEDIAQVIYNSKAAGIDTFGAVSVPIVDSQGETVNINFDRPSLVYSWIRVTILEKNYEEVFPENGTDVMRQELYDYCVDEFLGGDDFVLQKLFSPVYGVEGVKGVRIEIATTEQPTDSPTYGESNISITPFEVMQFSLDSNRITIIDQAQ